MTGTSSYIYVFDLVGSAAATQIVEAAPIASTVSSSIDGSWTITDADFAPNNPVLVITIHYSAYSGKSKLAGAQFMTPE